jgi:antitoxin MazE
MNTAHLIKIGNSKGLILPTELRRKCHIEEDVEYEVKNNRIIISGLPKQTRKGWREKLLKLKANEDRTPAFMEGISNNIDEDWV